MDSSGNADIPGNGRTNLNSTPRQPVVKLSQRPFNRDQRPFACERPFWSVQTQHGQRPQLIRGVTRRIKRPFPRIPHQHTRTSVHLDSLDFNASQNLPPPCRQARECQLSHQSTVQIVNLVFRILLSIGRPNGSVRRPSWRSATEPEDLHSSPSRCLLFLR